MTDLNKAIISIAKEAVENYIKKKACNISDKAKSISYLQEKKACFVCLKKDGLLRGCIGTITPDKPTLAEEIERNAISAATCDYRFQPVTEEELESIDYSVDVLSIPEKTDIASLDPKEYGVLVESSWKTGVLLPDLEGVDTVEEQLGIAKQKAGICETEEFEIYRFKVERFNE